MKSTNLQIMKSNGINVPDFITFNYDERLDINKIKSLNGDTFAIRSSCALEDSKKHSFAGQFDTFLNVKRENILEYINKVKASIHNYKLNYYCTIDKDYGIVEKNSKIIVQDMIDSIYSGVIFNANPAGILNETLITVGIGLGNNVVEDKINTTTYYYNTTNDVYYRDNNIVNLDDNIIKELIKISKNIKNIFNDYMDIEYAIDKNNKIWILQARNITTLNINEVITLDSSNIAESYPGITLPLSQVFVKDMYTTVFKNCILMVSKDEKLINNLDDTFNNMIKFVNGRAYYQMQSFYELLQLVPMSNKLIKIWQDSLGITERDISKPKLKVSYMHKIKYMIELLFMIHNTPDEMSKLNKYFSSRIGYYNIQLEKRNSIDELLELYNIIKNELGYKWGITLVNDLYAFIYTSLIKDKTKIKSIKSLESMKPALMMNDLIESYKNHRQDFDNKFSKYIELYGDRCIGELKLETDTYRTNPELLYRYIETHNKVKVVTIEDTKDNFIIKRAKLGIYNREISRLNRSRIYGIVRAIYLKIGTILVKENKLDNIKDIFYLTTADFNRTPHEIKNIVKNNKTIHKDFEKLPYYTRLEFINRVFDTPVACIESHTVINDSKLYGTPTSSGQCLGEVIVIDSADDLIDTNGKIVVTKTTDPGWIMLIQNSIGVIAERGSILSHTAIITRELNKPSIVNVKNVTSLLHTGDTISMNGNTGEIEIIHKEKKNKCLG